MTEADDEETFELIEELRELYGWWGLHLFPLCQPDPHAPHTKADKGEEGCSSPGKTPIKAWKKPTIERVNLAENKRKDGDEQGAIEILEQHLTLMAKHVNRGGNLGMMVPGKVMAFDGDSAGAVMALRAHPDLEGSSIQRTRKGAHFIVQAPVESVNWPQQTKVDLGNGLVFDMRLPIKGYLTVAPSIHKAGTAYEWEVEIPESRDRLPQLSDALVQRISNAVKTSKATSGSSNSKRRANESNERWPQGMRHGRIRDEAWKYAHDRLSFEELLDLIMGRNARKCDPPLAEREVRELVRSAFAKAETEGPEEVEFEPLGSIEAPALPPFPVDAMRPVAPFIDNVAAHTQTPPDLAGVCVLGFMAGALARKVQVDAGWTEELSLYIAPVGESGTRKSRLWGLAAIPILEHEAELRAFAADEIRANEGKLALLKRRLKNTETLYAKAGTADERSHSERDAITIRREMAEVSKGRLTAPRLLVSDVTPEKLATLVAENEERMILASGEGAQIFDRMFRYSQHGEPNMDLLLSGHAGERCSVDRQNADSLLLQRPVLTVVGAIQPKVLDDLSKNESFEGRGLLARFAYSFPRDVRGYRDVTQQTPLDAVALKAYKMRVSALLKSPFDFNAPLVLAVGGVAKTAFHHFAQWAEDNQREGGEFESMRPWASKAAGLVLRIAGVLAVADQPSAPEITVDVMERAIQLGHYFAEHSKRAHDYMAGFTGNQAVDKVWRWVLNRTDPAADFTKSELWQGVKGGRFRLARDLEGSLSQLCAAGRIARRTIRSSGAGRIPQVWAVNPESLPSDAERLLAGDHVSEP